MTPSPATRIIDGGGQGNTYLYHDIRPLALASLLSGLLLAACATPASEGTPTPPARVSTVAPIRSLRDIDFTASPYATDLSRRAGGGEVTAERVRLVDLTGDGVEEAVVVIESGGTLGDLGVGVYQDAASGPALVYFRKLAGRVDVRPPALVVIEGAPAPDDPACCPTQLRESVIEWRNGTFEVTAERIVANPTGGPPASSGSPGRN